MLPSGPVYKNLAIWLCLTLPGTLAAAEALPPWAAHGVTGAGAAVRVAVAPPAGKRFAHLSWPKAVRTKEGGIVLAYAAGTFHGDGGGGSPAVSISVDNGQTFSPPRILQEFGPGKEYDQCGNLALGTAEDGAILLLAMAYDHARANNIFGWRSADGGQSWTAVNTSALGPNKTGSVFGSILAVPGRGLIVLGHYRKGSQPYQTGIWMSSSPDQGKTWGEATRISDAPVVEPALVQTKGRLIAFARGIVPGSAEVAIVSDDGGKTWTTTPSVLAPESKTLSALAAPCAAVDPERPDEVIALTTERSKSALPSRIWLWRADAQRLDWRREKVLLEFPADKINHDLGYPWLLHLEGHRWLMFYYHGQMGGPNAIWVAEVTD